MRILDACTPHLERGGEMGAAINSVKTREIYRDWFSQSRGQFVKLKRSFFERAIKRIHVTNHEIMSLEWQD